MVRTTFERILQQLHRRAPFRPFRIELIQVGLIDASLKNRLMPELAQRYQQVLDQFEPILGNDIESTGASES